MKYLIYENPIAFDNLKLHFLQIHFGFCLNNM